MIIISVMLLLLTIPFFIYSIYKCNPMKKHTFIIYEIIAVAVLLFCSTFVVLDIPYIIKGGLKCDEAVIYTESHRYGTTVETQSGKRYWASDGQQYGNPAWVTSLNAAEEGEVELYVLPHTRLVYKVRQVRSRILETALENPKYIPLIYQIGRSLPYDLYKMREMSFFDFGLLLVTAMLWYGIYKEYTK